MNTAAIQHPHRKTTAELLRLIDNVEIATDNHHAKALFNARQQQLQALQRAAASEGHASAQRISNYLNNTHTTAMTQDPYRLDTSRVIPIVSDVVAPQACATQPSSECTFGECHFDPDCNYTCPDKPTPTAATAATAAENTEPTSEQLLRQYARESHIANHVGNTIAIAAIVAVVGYLIVRAL